MALRTTQIKNALLKYDTKWSDKEQNSSFANTIRDIYNNLPDNEEDRELSNDELYECIFCIINFSHSKLTKAEKKLRSKLYSKQCEQDTHLIHRMKFLSFLFEYNLLNQESYHYFYYEFNSLNLEDLQTQLFYLIQHRLLTPTIFNRLYTHNSIILLDACFIKTFQQIITSEYFEKIINYPDLPSLKQFCEINRYRWPKTILSAVLDHPNCLPLVLLYNNISSEDLLFFLAMDNQSTVIGILNHLHRITMKTPFDISTFLRQQNHDENMALLEKLNAQQIAHYSNFFLTNTNFQDFSYFIAASEQLKLENEGNNTLSDTLLIAFQDITKFSYILIVTYPPKIRP